RLGVDDEPTAGPIVGALQLRYGHGVLVKQFGLVNHGLVGRWPGRLVNHWLVGRWPERLVNHQIGLGCEESVGVGEVEGIGLGNRGLDGPRRK
ncbi:uncharacterized protein METZ01_LOCUS446065, partial [marine metagenome]